MALTSPLSLAGSGLLVGLASGLAPGPLLALVIAQTLRHNVGEGLKVTLAPLLTDLPIIVGALFLLQRVAAVSMLLGALALVGGGYVHDGGGEELEAGVLHLELEGSGRHLGLQLLEGGPRLVLGHPAQPHAGHGEPAEDLAPIADAIEEEHHHQQGQQGQGAAGGDDADAGRARELFEHVGIR